MAIQTQNVEHAAVRPTVDDIIKNMLASPSCGVMQLRYGLGWS